MKKLSFILLFTLTLTLTACEVNWFGETIDVPWYFVVIPIILIMAFGYIIIMRSYYKCPQCGTIFRPKWYQFSAFLHMNKKRLLKCPNCGKVSYSKRVKVKV